MRLFHRILTRTLRLLSHPRTWVLYVIVLFILSVIPLGRVNEVLMDNYTLSIRWDYLVHLAVYLPIPSLLFLGLKPIGYLRVFGVVLLILVIPALYEFAQMPLPYRFFNINDLLANEIGVVIGMGAWIVVKRRVGK